MCAAFFVPPPKQVNSSGPHRRTPDASFRIQLDAWLSKSKHLWHAGPVLLILTAMFAQSHFIIPMLAMWRALDSARCADRFLRSASVRVEIVIGKGWGGSRGFRWW